MEIRHASNPKDVKLYDTKRLRDEFLMTDLFNIDEVKLIYSFTDRIITGGAFPVKEELKLEAGKEIGADYFLQGRELGILNIGAEGEVILDGEVYKLKHKDGLYVGKGIKDVVFKSIDSNKPAKFYFNSAPAHKKYPTVKIDIDKAEIVKSGDIAQSNARRIVKYIDPSVCESCQLLMGMTILEPNNVWNTMPCHLHDRRMEVYFYFDMDDDGIVFQLMGEPGETRHIVMRNEQAAISPSWSIHSGVGTKNYTLVWSMVGENKTYSDIDWIDLDTLK